MPQNRVEDVGVRVAVVNDHGNIQFLCKRELRVEKRRLQFFFGIVVMVIQPDLPERDRALSFGRKKEGANLFDRLVERKRQPLRVGRMDPRGVLHPDKPLRLLFGEPRGFGGRPDVDDPRDIARKETLIS